jgi:hypothetical protein
VGVVVIFISPGISECGDRDLLGVGALGTKSAEAAASRSTAESVVASVACR